MKNKALETILFTLALCLAPAGASALEAKSFQGKIFNDSNANDGFVYCLRQDNGRYVWRIKG